MDVLEMASFTITRERAVELLTEAGFPRSPRQISRWCKNGALKAIKQPTKTGIERYVINAQSVEALIEKLRRGQEQQVHPQLYRIDGSGDAEDGTETTALVHHADRGHFDGVIRRKDEDILNLRAEVRAKDHLIDKLMRQTGGMGVEIGKLRGHVAQLEGQLKQLAAPRPNEDMAPSSKTTAQADAAAASRTDGDTKPSSLWRRLFGR